MKQRAPLRGAKNMVGKLRIAILRSTFLFSLQTWAMIVYSIIRDTGFLWWYVLVPIGIISWMIFDMVIIWKQELEISLKDNKEWRELRTEIKELKELCKKH